MINRFPSTVLHGLTPFEVLFGVKPSYTQLKHFGCLAHVSIPKVHRDKLSPRATACVFLGYPFGKKAYKFLNLENNSILISRDAKFHEEIFPFVKNSMTNTFVPMSVPDYVSSDTTPLVSSSQEPIHTQSTDDHHTPVLRKSSGPVKVPSYLQDYVHSLHAQCSSS